MVSLLAATSVIAVVRLCEYIPMMIDVPDDMLVVDALEA
jgi:hypothetical protein